MTVSHQGSKDGKGCGQDAFMGRTVTAPLWNSHVLLPVPHIRNIRAYAQVDPAQLSSLKAPASLCQPKGTTSMKKEANNVG